MTRSIDLNRRALFRGKLGGMPPVRPPWAIASQDFLDACTRCGDCTAACPEKIIVRGSGGYPTIDFSQGACTFCAACRDVCTTGALSASVSPPWWQKASIARACLAMQGVHCQSCRDSCETSAIVFPLRADVAGVVVPRIVTDRCTGCGACVSVCPAEAISVVALAV